jgi:hypothetical protein
VGRPFLAAASSFCQASGVIYAAPLACTEASDCIASSDIVQKRAANYRNDVVHLLYLRRRTHQLFELLDVPVVRARNLREMSFIDDHSDRLCRA